MNRQVLHLYLEGLGFRSIGRMLGVSNVSVLNWIRKHGEAAQGLHPQSQEIKLVEADDEMHAYIGKKTPVGHGWLLTGQKKMRRPHYWRQKHSGKASITIQ